MAEINLGRVRGSDANVTKTNIEAALDYTPADTNLIGLLASLTTEQKDNLVAAINEVNDGLSSHKAESVSEIVSLSRDLSLTGTQTVTLSNSKLPKLISVVSAVDLLNKISINNGGSTIYSVNDTKVFRFAGQHIAIADTNSNRTFGTIKNIRKGAFDIDWTHTGSGATGTVNIGIVLTYHGE